MVDLSSIGSVGTKMLLSWGFWLVLGFFVFFVAIGSLYMRKKGKFVFPALILTDLGGGKTGVRFTRAGWFKSKKMLGGLIDIAGERRLETKDGRVVQKGNTAHFHEIELKSGLILREKTDDPKILVPISKMKLTPNSKKVLMKIAPSDFRDASSNAIADAEKESLSRWETMAQVVVFGLVAIILFISIILTIQYAKNTMADAQALHREALTFYEKTLTRMSTTPSPTAP